MDEDLNNNDTRQHFLILIQGLNEPYFLHELNSQLTGFVTIPGFARIFARHLGEWLERGLFSS